MDTLHTMLRALRSETKSRDHLAVFREFLGHLDRIGKRGARRAPASPQKRGKATLRNGKR